MIRYSILLCLFTLTTLSAQEDLSWSGAITNPHGEPLGLVTIALLDEDAAVVATQTVDCDGLFSLEGLTANTTYTLSISRDGHPVNGVSTFDQILIAKHMLGTQLINDPYALAAADANGDGNISVIDILLVRALVLGVNTELPVASWRFFEQGSTVPINDTIISLTESLSGVTLIGVKSGDINGSYTLCE